MKCTDDEGRKKKKSHLFDEAEDAKHQMEVLVETVEKCSISSTGSSAPLVIIVQSFKVQNSTRLFKRNTSVRASCCGGDSSVAALLRAFSEPSLLHTFGELFQYFCSNHKFS